MTKKQFAIEVINILKNSYPDSGCSLEYEEPWKLLVSVRLAAQCTDARVNIVVKDLYEKYPTMQDIAYSDESDIEKIVRPCGLGKSKARDIVLCMRELLNRFDGRVPDTMDELLSLPGVGRKSANLILGDVYGKPAIVTDTHCIRLCNRIGLVNGVTEPYKLEKELWKIIPPNEGNAFCHRLVDHGREICTARTNPKCSICPLANICKKKI